MARFALHRFSHSDYYGFGPGFGSFLSYFLSTFGTFANVEILAVRHKILTFWECLVAKVIIKRQTYHFCGVFALYNYGDYQSLGLRPPNPLNILVSRHVLNEFWSDFRPENTCSDHACQVGFCRRWCPERLVSMFRNVETP